MSNTALNVDCVEYMKSLPDKAFDLAVVDPPYGDGNMQNGHCGGKGNWSDKYIYSQIVNVERESRHPNRRHVGGKVR